MALPDVDPHFEQLLKYLKEQRGFDFSGYKRSSLMRRVVKRMQEVGIERFDEYVDYLEVHPTEFKRLFDTVLINVTEFFRDPEAWSVLREEFIPAMLAAKPADAPIRVWSAGCASGEEPYSLVIALVEALGLEAFRQRVKVYATDLDEHALTQARQASYAAKDLENLSPEYRETYFERAGDRFAFRSDLRRMVIFGRHDLINDAPISHLDLLTCRNALMYFNSEVQGRILARFHFALNDSGYLFMGRAEMMRTHAKLFAPVSLKARIFVKSERPRLKERLLMIKQTDSPAESAKSVERRIRMREAALDADPAAHLLVDAQGIVVAINKRAREIFRLSEADVGRRIQDLRVSYLPVEIRSRIEEACATRRTVSVAGVQADFPNGEAYTLDVDICPLLDRDTSLGASVTFTDVTRYRKLHAAIQDVNHELETAYQELQSTNEELETTNEELQSTIEELETTNEELQSTNEELKTMNDEVQSANEELQTMNDELRQRSAEVDDLNAYLETIVASTRVAVVVVDRDLVVRVWSRTAENLWGVRASEAVGQALLIQKIGLPLEPLKAPIRACLDGASAHEETFVEAVDRRGKKIECRVTCSPFGPPHDVRGAVLTMEEAPPFHPRSTLVR